MKEKDKKIETGLPTPPDSPVLKPTKTNTEQSLDQSTNKILQEQEKIKEILKEKENQIWQLKTGFGSLKNQIKTLLGTSLAEDLPSNWIYQLTKKSNLITTQNELREWKNKFPNSTPQEISYKITQLQSEKSEVEKELKQVNPPTSTIYFCDVCQTTKNSKIDGEVYKIKISIRPNVISSVCPTCRPNVVMVSDDNWNDF